MEAASGAAPVPVPDAILWCSWCFKRSPLVMIERRYLGRNLLRCTLCWRYTAVCFNCSDGAARSQLNGETIDKLCACCQGAVSAWGAAPEEEAIMGHGWCSYCLTRNSFTLVQKNYLERNDYECDGCRRSACFCIHCGKAYTRSSAALCVKCEGSIRDWSKYEDNVKALLYGPAWCSWCLEFTAHRKEETNAVRRNVYECTACRQRTLPCTECKDGMAEGGPAWDDDLCERCRGRVSNWKDARLHKEKILTVQRSHEQIMTDLMLDCPERQRAAKEGLLRPFLLLVSMTASNRVLCAAALGWNLILTPSFGNPHREAYSILFERNIGMQPRTLGMFEKMTSHSAHVRWEGILRRVQQFVWHTLPDKAGEPEAEEALLLEIARTVTQRMTKAQKDALEDTDKKQHTTDELLRNAETNLTRAEIRLYAVSVCTALIVTPEGALAAAGTIAPAVIPFTAGATAVLTAFAGPLALLGLGTLLYSGAKLLWGSSEQRLLIPIILCLNQRILLAAQNIHWTDALGATPRATLSAPVTQAPTPAEAEAKRKVKEEEARREVEEAARKKVEEAAAAAAVAAKRKAAEEEADAKRKAEANEKAEAEALAKRKAEEEARVKAEAEAAAKRREEAARLKAQAEAEVAQKKAEEEAARTAAEAAKRKADDEEAAGKKAEEAKANAEADVAYVAARGVPADDGGVSAAVARILHAETTEQKVEELRSAGIDWKNWQLPEGEAAEAYYMFHKFDKDKSGTLNLEEVIDITAALMSNKMKPNLVRRLASTYFAASDTDKSGHVNLNEFIQVYTHVKANAK